MKKILIFAGTTEGRELSEILSEERLEHTVSVATEYAADLIKDNEYVTINSKRMDADEMKSFISAGDYSVVVDATHPYAYEVSENIKKALDGSKAQYIRLKRDIKTSVNNEMIRYFESNEECAKALESVSGNILLTTGSKELGIYAANENVRERLYVRIIPNEESLRICSDNGINMKNIIAMQGPFTEEMNDAMTGMYRISCIVTKQCGRNGGFEEKAKCALKNNIPLFVIGCEDTSEGLSLSETIGRINELTGLNVSSEPKFNISLIGTGMGSKDILTVEAKKAIDEADVYMGASRLLESVTGGDKYPVYKPQDIISSLAEIKEKSEKRIINVAILFSGDSSFFSGASGLYEELTGEERNGNIKADIKIIPGISSVSYFAAKIGRAYSGVDLLSIHGRKLNNIVRRIKSSKELFMLLSGSEDVRFLGEKLLDAGMESVVVTLGINLSYDDENIIRLSPKECASFEGQGLIISYIFNPNTEARKASHGLKDEEFSRNKTPMTKEEVREVSICKLRLKKDSVLLDVGSGTGSIAIESASLSDEIKVYAIERKEEALEILNENKSKFMLDNIEVIEGEAPEALSEITYATHAFIGGSGGRLTEILERLYKINPKMRVVINAVTMETVTELGKIEESFNIDNFEMVMMQVSRSDKAGSYNLMKAENPVWICSFDFVS